MVRGCRRCTAFAVCCAGAINVEVHCGGGKPRHIRAIGYVSNHQVATVGSQHGWRSVFHIRCQPFKRRSCAAEQAMQQLFQATPQNVRGARRARASRHTAAAGLQHRRLLHDPAVQCCGS